MTTLKTSTHALPDLAVTDTADSGSITRELQRLQAGRLQRRHAAALTHGSICREVTCEPREQEGTRLTKWRWLLPEPRQPVDEGHSLAVGSRGALRTGSEVREQCTILASMKDKRRRALSLTTRPVPERETLCDRRSHGLLLRRSSGAQRTQLVARPEISGHAY